VGRNAPVSHFDVRGALGNGRNSPIASKHEREVWGAPVSRFDARGALGSGRNTPIASKCEREV